MTYVLIALKLFATMLLIGIAIYSWVYFSQVRKIEKQFELKLPVIIKRLLGLLSMLPMALSIVVLVIVLIEIVSI